MLFFNFLSLLSCVESSLMKVVEVKPRIIVHPQELFFGNIQSGHESGEEIFSIINTGNSDLYVDPILIDGSTRYDIPEFENDQLLIQPGEILDIPVTYLPITYEHNGAVVKIISNDEENPEIFVRLEGYGDAPKIEVDPEYVDYGNISLGCDNQYRITIENIGNLDLVITDTIQMSTMPNDITIDYGSLNMPPWNILPSEQIDLLIKYIPSDIGYDESIISIESNDPQKPQIELIQKGVGDIEHWIVDEWIQEEDKIYDIIWVIDNSGSMMGFQNNLMTNMHIFFNQFFAQQDVDYHVGFITTDWHTLVGNTFINKNTVNPINKAIDIISTIGTGGSGQEMGLRELDESLNYYKSAGEFLREDANLIAIFLSDEDDNSFLTVNEYINAYSVIKDPAKIKMYGVIGEPPSGCEIHFGNLVKFADFGQRYYEIINYFGGSWFSICSLDWAGQMTNIANDILTRSRFPLSKPDPIVNTIEVYVNSQIITTGYIYDSIDNQIVFEDGSIPLTGQTVRIEYATYGCGN